ncbi:thioredoxin family protein [Sungkyunkwania multivorans]|uniref:Thioredoxin family protein n=1 Tax=Sungkyunkwania multivorans TaxID=1173618 RepID=A0ABW3CWS4_9FLAO
MKKIISLLVIVAASTLMTQAQELQWHTNLEEAKEVAKENKKTILLYFTGSDWCAPCKMLKKDFWNSQEFLRIADNFVLVELDEPRRMDIISDEQRKYNRSVAKKYNKQGSYPLVVAMSYKGKVLDELSGYSMLRDTSLHFALVNRFVK